MVPNRPSASWHGRPAVQTVKGLIQVPWIPSHLSLRLSVQCPPNQLLARPTMSLIWQIGALLSGHLDQRQLGALGLAIQPESVALERFS